MSVIGPRPGLWNQDILTAERDKYNANDVKPGLTGWAQINGRDGVISIVMIFITFCDAIVSGGFGNAIVQKKDADELDVNTIL